MKQFEKMTLQTFIARVSDPLILVATIENDADSRENSNLAKKILKSLHSGSPARCSVDAGPYVLHYMIENDVCYMTATEKSFPKKLVFPYLEELSRDFSMVHGNEVASYSRPYQANNFDPRLRRIREGYVDPDSPNTMKKLHSDLNQIHNVMCENIQEVLKRGEKVNTLENRSSMLLQGSKKFHSQAKQKNWQALMAQVKPLVAVGVVLLLFIYFRFLR